MKPLHTFMAVCTLLTAEAVQAQSAGIGEVLRIIESNNKELKMNAASAEARKADIRSTNNLPDPTLSYAHLWNNKDSHQTISELVVTQSFDFPTVYATRHRMNRAESNALDAETRAFRQELLLQAQETCFDLLLLQQQEAILDERLQQATTLEQVYRKRLESGETGILEINKVKLELLNARSESRAHRTAIENKRAELVMLNGGIPLPFTRLDETPLPALPADYESLHEEVFAATPALQSIAARRQAADKLLALNRQGWLPKLELGYRRNTESAVPFNGVVVGFSFPVFSNRHKVKSAQMQLLGTDYEKEQTVSRLDNALEQLYREALSLRSSILEYENAFRSQQDLQLLKKALEGGEISLVTYFAETTIYYQSKQNQLRLENEYRKAVARMCKHRL